MVRLALTSFTRLCWLVLLSEFELSLKGTCSLGQDTSTKSANLLRLLEKIRAGSMLRAALSLGF